MESGCPARKRSSFRTWTWAVWNERCLSTSARDAGRLSSPNRFSAWMETWRTSTLWCVWQTGMAPECSSMRRTRRACTGAQGGHARNVIATIHTCGKALASAGAFVCGSATLRDHLINHARTFIFSTAMPPYMAGPIRAALRLAKRMDAERDSLRNGASEFATALRRAGWDLAGSTSQIVPAIIGGDNHAVSAAEHLRQRGFFVRAIRPPTVPEGRARLRFSLTCRVGREELTRLRGALEEWRTRDATHTAVARA